MIIVMSLPTCCFPFAPPGRAGGELAEGPYEELFVSGLPSLQTWVSLQEQGSASACKAVGAPAYRSGAELPHW